MATGNFELIMGRALRGYVFVYGSKIQDIPKKSVVKALWHILLKVKTEWPNVLAPKSFF